MNRTGKRSEEQNNNDTKENESANGKYTEKKHVFISV